MTHLDHLYEGVPTQEGDTVNPIYHTRPNQRRERFRISGRKFGFENSVYRYLYQKEAMALTNNPSVVVDADDDESNREGFTDEELIHIVRDTLMRRLANEDPYSKRAKALERVAGALGFAGHELYLMRKEQALIEDCRKAKEKSV